MLICPVSVPYRVYLTVCVSRIAYEMEKADLTLGTRAPSKRSGGQMVSEGDWIRIKTFEITLTLRTNQFKGVNVLYL